MMKDKGKSDRNVTALSWRLGISVALFVMLLIGAMTGIIEPQGSHPT